MKNTTFSVKKETLHVAPEDSDPQEDDFPGSQSVFFEGAGIKKGFDKDSAWIQTHSGRRFCPTNPNPDAIVIQDVAHSLSMQCRFTGHCKKFYCVTEEQRILTADLKWIPAGDLKTSDHLIGFDEYTSETGKPRRYRKATIGHLTPIKRKIVKIFLEDGTMLRASSEHPWLLAKRVGGKKHWRTSEEILHDIELGRTRTLYRYLDPWSESTGKSSDWLSGVYDGEGSLVVGSNGNRETHKLQLRVSQNPGIVLDEIKEAHRKLGFDFRCNWQNTEKKCVDLTVKGGIREILKLLGSIRPIRLVEKFARKISDANIAMIGDGCPLKIVAAEYDGEDWCMGLETSTHTYMCEGFGAHNSVAQHSVLASYICDENDRLWALLHDASEAYLVDVPRPLKRSGKFQAYLDYEVKMQKAICRRFGLPLREPPSVKKADQALLATEARDLMSPLHPDWDWPIEPLPFVIETWDPQKAKDLFMKRFFELTGSPYGYEHYLHYKDQL